MVSTYEVVPGKSVGIFQLGDSLWHVLDLLRTDKTSFPKIEVSWNPDIPHKSAVTIHIPHISLYFPHPSQTLQQITLPDIQSSIASLNLVYDKNQVLSSQSQPLTRARVGKLLGPTYANGTKLVYPGMTFGFDEAGTGKGGRDEEVKSLSVGPKGEGEVACLSPITSVVIQPGRGVILNLWDGSFEIKLGETTAQDILLDLGHPLRKYWKEDDRMEKMWGNAEDNNDSGIGSCFWNYFQHGIDTLISQTGLVTKVVVHSNIPGTPLFQRYAKCPWTLPPLDASTSPLTSSSSMSQFRAQLSTNAKAQYVDEVRLSVPASGPQSKQSKKGSKRVGSPVAPVPSVLGAVAASEEDQGDAMVLDRVVEGGLDGIVGVGSSRLFGFDGVIIEEDQESGGICSVLVWKDDSFSA